MRSIQGFGLERWTRKVGTQHNIMTHSLATLQSYLNARNIMAKEL